MEYLGEIGLILLVIVLAIICIPVLIGIGLASLLGIVGLGFYAFIIVVSILIWTILYFLWIMPV